MVKDLDWKSWMRLIQMSQPVKVLTIDNDISGLGIISCVEARIARRLLGMIGG